MSWQSDIVDAIESDDDLSALIVGRIYADVAPGESIAPYIVYQHISEDGETRLDGERVTIFPLVQFSCWAKTKANAIAVSVALMNAIEGKDIPGTSNASLGFSNQDSTRDQQTKLFCERIDYRVSCNRN